MRIKRLPNLKCYLLGMVLLLAMGCGTDGKQMAGDADGEPRFQRDLKAIKKDGKLRALTVYSGTTYFLYRGLPMGYEFEMLERFADYLDVELELVVAKDMNDLIGMLNRGEGDILAHGLTITAKRKERIAFTDYLYLTRQVLVQKKPDNWRSIRWSVLKDSLVQNAIGLLGDTVAVRKNSSYNERISNLSEELGDTIYIKELSGEMATDEIIKKVVEGEIEYTVADDNIAGIMASYYPILDIEVPVSFSQRIAWATRQNSPELLKATNAWLREFKKEADYNVIFKKYFKNKKNFRRRVKSPFYSLNKSEISPYDALIKTHSAPLDWDWRLVASLIYQESRFDPENSSWANAQGLMQLMPAVAEELGVTDVNDPDQNIWGGTRFLGQLSEKFKSIEDSIQRIKFTMASYNCGLYHVRDAQKLAKKRNLDPMLWDDNVEDMILELSSPENYNDPVVKYGYVRGIEPYKYVRQIFERHKHYAQVIDK